LATTRDNSPLAEAIPSPVRRDVILSYFALLSRVATITNLETKEVKISNIAGIMKMAISDTYYCCNYHYNCKVLEEEMEHWEKIFEGGKKKLMNGSLGRLSLLVK
jgi:hypothetical protein